MREVNFSIPNANKASVGITTALYDRRALDCTSTLPLINSLNNLAYLTTSSARIRDILTVDGGVERLVCILKQGRKLPPPSLNGYPTQTTKEMMECWKWNLAFQCVVNIGVRGSENVRTRVVEADMVPVIATILDNYVRVIDKCREKADQEYRKRDRRYEGSSSRGKYDHRPHELGGSAREHGQERMRRQAPPPIEIPTPLRDATNESSPLPLPAFSLSSPPERTTFSRGHQHARSTVERTQSYQHSTPSHSHAHSHSHSRPHSHGHQQPLQTAIPSIESLANLRPVRDADRLPSSAMLPLPTEASSRPDSPTTPNAPPQPPEHGLPLFRRVVGRRPSVRHQASMSQDSDEMPEDAEAQDDAILNDSGVEEPLVGIESDLTMQDMNMGETLIEGDSPVRLENAPQGPPEVDAFNLARSAIESSLSTVAANHQNNAGPANLPAPNITINPIPALNTMTMNATPLPQPMQVNPIARYAHERSANSGILTSMPRDEDVLMCLQLLAYVSKYCGLRSYFQQSHLVPKLKIPEDELSMFDADSPSTERTAMCPSPMHIDCDDEDDISASPTIKAHSHDGDHDHDHDHDTEADDSDDEDPLTAEWLQPSDFNIFPLVEKFTVRHHTADMQYWAGVVMRNLCRKDDSRGGIRQCAYYQCGKWEEYTRQFAKCRRCRRTKYCSKECQKSAWVYHRHWCVAAAGGAAGERG